MMGFGCLSRFMRCSIIARPSCERHGKSLNPWAVSQRRCGITTTLDVHSRKTFMRYDWVVKLS